MTNEHLKHIAWETRKELENREVKQETLAGLYTEYADVPDVISFIEQAQDLFPRLNCGIASALLRHKLNGGAITQGRYGSMGHTFLLVDGKTVVDVTADQYGGPPVYVGALEKPWSLS